MQRLRETLKRQRLAGQRQRPHPAVDSEASNRDKIQLEGPDVFMLDAMFSKQAMPLHCKYCTQ